MLGFDEVLASAKDGDEASFVALFRSVQPALLRYLTTLGGPQLAEDAAAETWVSVVKGLKKFKGDEAGWRAWVFTIAHARLRDAQRRAARQPVPTDTDAVLGSNADAVDVHADVEALISTEAALALIRRLPPDQAAAVLLRYVAGLDVSQAAKVLGKRPGAVRVAAHRGLKRLQQLMEPPAEEGAGGGYGATAQHRAEDGAPGGVTDSGREAMTE